MDRVLLLEQDQIFCQIVSSYLSSNFNVKIESPSRAFHTILDFKPHVIILSFEAQSNSIVQQLRRDQNLKNTGVLMTVMDQNSVTLDAVHQMGADNIIVKPPKLEHILWQIKWLIQRVKKFQRFQSLLFYWKNSELNVATHILKTGNEEHSLTPLQSQILRAFFENPDRMLTREWLRLTVWNDSKISSRSIDAHISKLKKAVGKFSVNLESVYGKGYLLTDRNSRLAL